MCPRVVCCKAVRSFFGFQNEWGLENIVSGAKSTSLSVSRDSQCLPGVGGLEREGEELREELDDADDEDDDDEVSAFIFFFFLVFFWSGFLDVGSGIIS